MHVVRNTYLPFYQASCLQHSSFYSHYYASKLQNLSILHDCNFVSLGQHFPIQPLATNMLCCASAHKGEIMKQLSFCSWLVLWSIMFPGFIQVTTNGRIFFFLMRSNSTSYVFIFFFYPLICQETFRSWLSWAIVNPSEVDMGVQTVTQGPDFIYFGYILKCGIARS
jgi:hypothetical protein